MKDQYVGDVNDFLKYSILEIIEKTFNKKILVAWMLTESEGMDIKYSQYKKYNELLFSNLQKIISSNKRKIESIEKIYSNYIFHSELLKKQNRIEYFDEVYKKSSNADIVFFDPDNGISFNNNNRQNRYIYMDELKRFWNKGKDLIIYQHFRRQKWNEYIIELEKHIKINNLKNVFLTPVKTKNVMFLYFAHKDIKETLRVSLFKSWDKIIEIIDVEEKNGNN